MTTIDEEITSWAATRPGWQQAVLQRLAEGESFGHSDVEAIAAELKAGEHPTPPRLRTTSISGLQAAGVTVALRSIRDVHNVNALLEAQELALGAAGLTVVYGDNGSGKSGYARLIKDAVGARDQEAVHTNVFADTAGSPQRATITFTAAGVTKTSTWPDASGSELHNVKFYDEACGDAYVGGESELTYRPSALQVLDGLIAVCDALRGVLDEDLRQNQAARGPLPAVTEGTGPERFLSLLSGSTTKQDLDAACAVPADAHERLGIVLKEEARLRATDPSAERVRLQALAGKVETVAEHVAGLAGALSDERAEEATAARSKARELRAAATAASSDKFDAEPLSGVGSVAWQALWDAARHFSEQEAHHERHFPATGDGARCVLCQQELTTEGSSRLERFESFMQDTFAQQAAAAEDALENANSAVRLLEPTPAYVAALLVELEALEPTLASVASGWLERATASRASLLSLFDGSSDTWASPGSSPTLLLTARARELRASAVSIDATQFEVSLTNAIAEKSELEARIALAGKRAEVEGEIRRLAERHKLGEARRLTDTSGITRKTSELTEAHVTSLVRDRFTRESDRLHLERIELKRTGGHKGKLRHRPSMLGAKNPKPVEQVLSEGEQTALGLAGYLTEAYFDESRSALVLDDPVTSLDHIRRHHVARRLAQFATDRQVIVFTHDVAFVGDLRRTADEEQVTFTERGVQRRGDKKPGLLTDQHPWKVKDVPRRFDELVQALGRIRRERAIWDQATYEKECADWAGKLSETWERLINLEIVYMVVDHGTSEVRPKMFKLLARITEADDREFQQSYGRCSAWARRHDKSPAANYVAPEPEELEREIAFVKAWFDRIRRYRA